MVFIWFWGILKNQQINVASLWDSIGPIESLCWDNYKDYTYVGSLDGLYQHSLIAAGTRLRPVEATFLGHILGTKPQKNIWV